MTHNEENGQSECECGWKSDADAVTHSNSIGRQVIEHKKTCSLYLSVKFDDNDHTVRYYDEYGDGLTGTLFLLGHEFGPTHLIQADTFEDAYGVWVDLQQTIAESEVWEAYGYDTVEAYVKFCDGDNNGDWPDLIEGYRYQDNTTGTGIVNVGDYEWQAEVKTSTVELVRV